MSAPPCPECHVALEPFVTEDHTAIDVCPRCRGAWFDRGELGRMLGTGDDLETAAEEDVPMLGHDPASCPRCASVCMNRVPYRAGASVFVDRCPYCGGVWAPLTQLPAMRALRSPVRAERQRAAVVAPPTPPTPPPSQLVYADPDAPPVPRLSVRAALIALPAAYLASAVWRLVSLSYLIPGGARTPLHELGHALAAWLCGFAALPIPIGFTYIGAERSTGLWLVAQAALIAGAAFAVRRRAYGWAAVAAFFVVAQDALTWGLTPSRQEALFLWAGGAGELTLATVLVVLFHQSLPPKWRWDLARWIALPMGAFLLLDRAIFWWKCSKDHDLIPWGAAFSDESDGDLFRLAHSHGWSEDQIVGRYLTLSVVCLLVTVFAWAVAVFVALRTRDDDARP